MVNYKLFYNVHMYTIIVKQFSLKNENRLDTLAKLKSSQVKKKVDLRFAFLTFSVFSVTISFYDDGVHCFFENQYNFYSGFIIHLLIFYLRFI
jgi:hypothetical protein